MWTLSSTHRYHNLSAIRVVLLFSSRIERTEEIGRKQTPPGGIDDNHHNNLQNGPQTDPQNGPQNNPQAINVCNPSTNDNPHITGNLTIICNHDESHRKLAYFEKKKQEEGHTRRCLARDGNDIIAEDFSKDALARIVRDERAKNAQEIDLLEAEVASHPHQPEDVEMPPKLLEENDKSQEITKLKKKIKQIQDEHNANHEADLNGRRDDITQLGGELFRSRGANSSQDMKVTQCQDIVAETRQEVTQIILTLFWNNRQGRYQLVLALRELLLNLPLEQFLTAPANINVQFLHFRWILQSFLPNDTLRSPCGGSLDIPQDNLRHQLSLIHPGSSNVVPNYGLSNGLSFNNNTTQPVYCSNSFAVPNNTQQQYFGPTFTQTITPPHQQNFGPGISHTITPPHLTPNLPQNSPPPPQQYSTTGISRTFRSHQTIPRIQQHPSRYLSSTPYIPSIPCIPYIP